MYHERKHRLAWASVAMFALSTAAAAAPKPAAQPAGVAAAGTARQDGQPTLEFVFDEVVTLAAAIPVGDTPYGGRNIVPITGGTFEGPAIRGQILPGGWDWQLRRPDGCLDIKADYMLRTDDGVVINIVNRGIACRPEPGKPSAIRVTPVFEAPIGRYDWLNRSTFVGTLEPARAGESQLVRIRFFAVR